MSPGSATTTDKFPRRAQGTNTRATDRDPGGHSPSTSSSGAQHQAVTDCSTRLTHSSLRALRDGRQGRSMRDRAAFSFDEMSLATYPLLQEDGGGQKERIFEKREAPFHSGLGFVYANGLLVSQVARVEHVGSDDEAGAPLRLTLQLLFVQRHRCLYVPALATGQRVLGRASPVGIVRPDAHGTPHLQPAGQRLESALSLRVRIGLTGELLIAPVPELPLPLLLVLLCPLPHAGSRPSKTRLSDHHDPALHPLRQLQVATEPARLAVCARLPVVGLGWLVAHQRPRLARGLGRAADPAYACRCKTTHVRLAIYTTVGHVDLGLLSRLAQMPHQRLDGLRQLRALSQRVPLRGALRQRTQRLPRKAASRTWWAMPAAPTWSPSRRSRAAPGCRPLMPNCARCREDQQR